MNSTNQIDLSNYYGTLPTASTPSFYDSYMKISLSNPYVCAYDNQLMEDSQKFAALFQQVKANEGPDLGRCQNEFKYKSMDEKDLFRRNLLYKVDANIRLGNEISVLSWVVLKIANFILPLFGYEPYLLSNRYPEIDFKAFETFKKKAIELTPEERANTKYLIESTDSFINNLNLTDSFEQLRMGWIRQIDIKIDNKNKLFIFYNKESQEFILKQYFVMNYVNIGLPGGFTTFVTNIKIQNLTTFAVENGILSEEYRGLGTKQVSRYRPVREGDGFTLNPSKGIALKPGFRYWLSEEPSISFSIKERGLYTPRG